MCLYDGFALMSKIMLATLQKLLLLNIITKIQSKSLYDMIFYITPCVLKLLNAAVRIGDEGSMSNVVR